MPDVQQVTDATTPAAGSSQGPWAKEVQHQQVESRTKSQSKSKPAPDSSQDSSRHPGHEKRPTSDHPAKHVETDEERLFRTWQEGLSKHSMTYDQSLAFAEIYLNKYNDPQNKDYAKDRSAVSNWLQEQESRPSVELDLTSYVRQHKAPTDEQIGEAIAKSLGFTDAEMYLYAAQQGKTNPGQAFFVSAGGDSGKYLLDRASRDPLNRTLIGDAQPHAIENLRKWLRDERAEHSINPIAQYDRAKERTWFEAIETHIMVPLSGAAGSAAESIGDMAQGIGLPAHLLYDRTFMDRFADYMRQKGNDCDLTSLYTKDEMNDAMVMLVNVYAHAGGSAAPYLATGLAGRALGGAGAAGDTAELLAAGASEAQVAAMPVRVLTLASEIMGSAQTAGQAYDTVLSIQARTMTVNEAHGRQLSQADLQKRIQEIKEGNCDPQVRSDMERTALITAALAAPVGAIKGEWMDELSGQLAHGVPVSKLPEDLIRNIGNAAFKGGVITSAQLTAVEATYVLTGVKTPGEAAQSVSDNLPTTALGGAMIGGTVSAASARSVETVHTPEEIQNRPNETAGNAKEIARMPGESDDAFEGRKRTAHLVTDAPRLPDPTDNLILNAEENQPVFYKGKVWYIAPPGAINDSHRTNLYRPGTQDFNMADIQNENPHTEMLVGKPVAVRGSDGFIRSDWVVQAINDDGTIKLYNPHIEVATVEKSDLAAQNPGLLRANNATLAQPADARQQALQEGNLTVEDARHKGGLSKHKRYEGTVTNPETGEEIPVLVHDSYNSPRGKGRIQNDVRAYKLSQDMDFDNGFPVTGVREAEVNGKKTTVMVQEFRGENLQDYINNKASAKMYGEAADLTKEEAALLINPNADTSLLEKQLHERAQYVLEWAREDEAKYPGSVAKTENETSAIEARFHELINDKERMDRLRNDPELQRFRHQIEEAVVERQIYGAFDAHALNFIAVEQNGQTYVRNIDLDLAFGNEQSPRRTAIADNGHMEPIIQQLSGAPLSPDVVVKLQYFLTRIKSPAGIEHLREIGYTDQEIRGITGRTQWFVDHGTMPSFPPR